MTVEKALELVKSTIADGLITAAVYDMDFWKTIRDALEELEVRK